MGSTIGQVLSFGVGVALSPVPIIGVVLMLATPRARGNSLGFLLGWVNVLKLVLGVLLLLVALKQWRGRPKAGEEPPLPAWMQKIDGFTPVKSTGLGFLLAGVNPKNLLLVVAAQPRSPRSVHLRATRQSRLRCSY